MAGSVSVRLEGAEGFANRVKLLLPQVRRRVQDAVALSALLIETDAKRFAPVDTGRLRASIHADFAADRLSAEVADGVSYGIFVEFGRRGQRAQPFLFPAYEKNRLAFVANLKQALKLF